MQLGLLRLVRLNVEQIFSSPYASRLPPYGCLAERPTPNVLFRIPIYDIRVVSYGLPFASHVTTPRSTITSSLLGITRSKEHFLSL